MVGTKGEMVVGQFVCVPFGLVGRSSLWLQWLDGTGLLWLWWPELLCKPRLSNYG